MELRGAPSLLKEEVRKPRVSGQRSGRGGILIYTFPVRRSSLARWLRKSVEAHKKIIRLAAAQEARGLADYFRDVHWSAERNLKFIEDAFERDGHAAIHI